MTPTITAPDGSVTAAHITGYCKATNEGRSIYLTRNGTDLNVSVAAWGGFGIDLTPDQACDLGSALLAWAKTGRLEVGSIGQVDNT